MNQLSLVFYLVSHAALACSLGILTSKLRFSAVPRPALFFAGAALTPYVYGSITLLLLLLPVRLPALVFTLLPVVLSAVVLLTNQASIARIVQHIRSIRAGSATAMLAAVALFPLLSCSTEIGSFLQTRSLPQQLLFSAVCGGLLSLALSLPLKHVFPPLRRARRFWVYALIGVFAAAAIFLANVAGNFSNLRQGLVPAGVSLAVIAALALVLPLLARSVAKMERKHARIAAGCFAALSAGLILYRVGVQAVSLNISNTNQRITITAALAAFLLALVLLALFGLKRAWNRAPEAPNQPSSLPAFLKTASRFVVILCCIVALLNAGSTIAARAVAPVTGADAMEYMTAGYEIANGRTMDSVAGYNSSESGSQIGFVHHPVWVAYLAQGLMHGSGEPFAFPNDLSARATYALTYVYLFVAVFALARAFLPNRFALLAAALSGCTPQLGYILSVNSREGFRIVPILVFILILFGYARAVSKERRVLWPELAVVFLTASFTMMGHVLNGIPAAAIAVSIVLFCLLSRNFHLGTVWMGVSAFLGGLFGCIQILLGYLERGQLLSDFISLDYMLAGTPYLENFKAYQASRLGDTQTYLDRLNVLLRYDHGVLTFVGAAFGVFFLVLLIRSASKRKAAEISGLLGLIGIGYALLFTDLFSWSGYTLSEWSVMNIRYLSHLYPLYAVLVAGGLAYVSRMQIKKALLRIAVTAAVCVYAIYPVAKIGVTYPVVSVYPESAGLASCYAKANQEYDRRGGRILIDNYYCNYYFNCEGMTIFSDAATEIRRAHTLPALKDALKRANINAILITGEFIPVYWQNTVLLELVSSGEYQMRDYGFFQVYELI